MPKSGMAVRIVLSTGRSKGVQANYMRFLDVSTINRTVSCRKHATISFSVYCSTTWIQFSREQVHLVAMVTQVNTRLTLYEGFLELRMKQRVVPKTIRFHDSQPAGHYYKRTYQKEA